MARLQSLRDTPNTAREYETIYILRPNTPNEGVAEVNTRIKGVIEGMGGKIIKVDNWGKRRLAYEVAKERKGIYLYWQYLAQPGVVEECERNLRMLDNVIRYLTTKVDENIDVGARPTEIDETSYARRRLPQLSTLITLPPIVSMTPLMRLLTSATLSFGVLGRKM